MQLQNHVALITGSSSGIGKAVALLFAQEGAKVVVNCRSSIDRAKKVVEEIKQSGGDAFYVQADVSQEDDVDRMFDEIKKKYGDITILVNNAGATEPKTLAESNKDHWIGQLNDKALAQINI